MNQNPSLAPLSTISALPAEECGPIDYPAALLVPLIGRAQECEEIALLLRHPLVRLVSLVGPAGVGKTHLAHTLFYQQRTAFADGGYAVSLASTRDSTLIASTIVRGLGLHVTTDAALLSTLSDALREKQALLLLDNFEQVIAGAPLLLTLLNACPQLKIFVTSREILRLQGEHVYHLSPLETPDLRIVPNREQLAQNPSIALFVARAQAHWYTFRLTTANMYTIANICVQLDGLPLALELAAARLKLLSPRSLLARLKAHRLMVLGTNVRNAPLRQQTLRQTLQWSYDLLDSEETRLFQRCAVFVGGCTLSTLETLYTLLGEPSEPLLDIITSLLDKNLLRRQEEAETERLTMLETIHEFALERLEASGEAAQVRQAHAEYYLRLAEQAEQELQGPHMKEWLGLLESECDNLHVMLEWFTRHAGQGALRAVLALPHFWIARGDFNAGYRWLNAALQHSQDAPLATKARALDWAGIFAYELQDYAQSEIWCQQSLQAYQALGNTNGSVDMLLMLARMLLRRELYQEAKNTLMECLALAREIDHWQSASATLHFLAEVARIQGDFLGARVLTEECMALYKEHNEITGVMYQLGFLIKLALDQAQHARASALTKEALLLTRNLQKKAEASNLLAHLAMVLNTAYEFHNGVTITRILLEDSLTLARESGEEKIIAGVLLLLGQLAIQHRAIEQASLFLEEYLALARAANDKRRILNAQLKLVDVALYQKNSVQASSLLEVCQALLQEAGSKREEVAYLEKQASLAALEGKTELTRHFLSTAANLRAQLDLPRSSLIAAAADPDQARGSGLNNTPTVTVNAPTQKPGRSGQAKRTSYRRSSRFTTPTNLSKRELDVLRLLVQGFKNTEIAEQLVLSPVTVSSYLRSIYNKLDVSTRLQAMRYALDHHLLEEHEQN